MKKQSNWIWKTYFLIYLIFAASSAVNLFSPAFQQFQYYQICFGYDNRWLILSLFAGMSVLLNVITLAPFYCSLYRVALSRRTTWQVLFFLRLFFDLTGHSFELAFIKSFARDNPLFIISFVTSGALIILPSYIALFHYAFRWNWEEQLEFE